MRMHHAVIFFGLALFGKVHLEDRLRQPENLNWEEGAIQKNEHTYISPRGLLASNRQPEMAGYIFDPSLA